MVQKMAMTSPIPVFKGLKAGIEEVTATFWTINDPPGIPRGNYETRKQWDSHPMHSITKKNE